MPKQNSRILKTTLGCEVIVEQTFPRARAVNFPLLFDQKAFGYKNILSFSYKRFQQSL